MQMMSAAVLDTAPGTLRIEQIPVPEPRAGEILIRVSACGVCHTDLHIMKAEVAFPLPAVLGHEISGVVASLGPGVKGPAPGTAVASAFIMPCGYCPACGAGRDDLCDNFFAMNRLRGTLYDGTSRLARVDGTPIAMYSMAGLAEYAVVPATDVFPLPANLPLAESSVLGCAVFTAYGAVRHAADVRGGERIAVVATGGVGLSIIEVARAFGASQIIAIDVRDDRLDMARQLGATDTVNGAKVDVLTKVRELTDGRGVDVAIEALGTQQTFEACLRVLRPGGTLSSLGVYSGKLEMPYDSFAAGLGGQRIVTTLCPGGKERMRRLIATVESGRFDPLPLITHRFSLDDIVKGYDLFSNRRDGVLKVVITP